MRNIAKCKKCKSIIESLHSYDHVTCQCGEIGVSGGPDEMKCHAADWENFLRVDEQGNEILPTIQEIEVRPSYTPKPTKKELLKMMDEMIEGIERLPPHAMFAPVTHADLLSALLLISSLFRSCKDKS